MDTFASKTPLEREEEKHMKIVTDLDVYNSAFNTTKQNNRFAIYTLRLCEDHQSFN